MKKRTYRIGEAARLLDLEGYVLRFWETEFSQLRPVRTAKGQRIYSEADIALLRRIRFHLHEQGLTIEGARRVLGGAPEPTAPPVSRLVPAQGFLLAPKDSGRAEEECRQLTVQKAGLEDELCHVRDELKALRELLRNETRS